MEGETHIPVRSNPDADGKRWYSLEEVIQISVKAESKEHMLEIIDAMFNGEDREIEYVVDSVEEH